MAMELSTKTERVEQLFNDLEAQRKLLTSCTNIFTTLTSHFTSLQDSLSQKSESLDSKFLSLQTTSTQSFQSLSDREASIADREAAAVDLLNRQKAAALDHFLKPSFCESLDLSESLKSLCRRMDSSQLMKFIISKRKESVSLRAELPGALRESVDAPRLVLDAVDEFYAQKVEGVGVTDKRWACGILLQAIFPESDTSNKSKGPVYATSIVERAAGILDNWKKQMAETELSAAEAVMFLQIVVCFGLTSRFDHDFYRKLVLEFASRRDMAKLAARLGLGDQLSDIVDTLVSTGKEIEAVYFASESGLTEKFPPVDLLKSYLRNSRKIAASKSKNGKQSGAATEDSSNMELNSIKSIIKCVEDHKLQAEFSIDNLKRRVSQLEKTRADRKRSLVTNSKPQPHKRGEVAGSSRASGSTPQRPSKAAKFSSAYHSVGRRNATPSAAQLSPAARYSGPYNYPSQVIYDRPTTIHYASNYGVPHTQSPAAIPQQHFSLPMDSVGGAGFSTSGSYGAQSSFSAYDYSSAAPSSYQS